MAKGFLKDMRSELKKVVWPTKKQIVNNTLWVLILVVVVSLLVLVMDLVLKAGDTKLWNAINGSTETNIYTESGNDTDTLTK